MEKYKVPLTVEERTALEHLVSAGKGAARKLAHARVLLLADEGPGGPRRNDEDIVEVLHVSPSTIAQIRKRFVTEPPPAGSRWVRPSVESPTEIQYEPGLDPFEPPEGYHVLMASHPSGHIEHGLRSVQRSS